MPPLKNKELILRMSPYCESSASLDISQHGGLVPQYIESVFSRADALKLADRVLLSGSKNSDKTKSNLALRDLHSNLNLSPEGTPTDSEGGADVHLVLLPDMDELEPFA